jgi:3-(3-hydroxy-phenyl)propionate hydroxylase
MADGDRDRRVVIVGAGPVGMVCALALNRRGVPVIVFEQEPAPVTDQRAASIHPPTLELLDELGVAQTIIPLGLKSPSYRFHDRVTGSVVAEFDLGRMSDEFRFPFVLQYEQYKLTASITTAYADASDFDVRFSHAVIDIHDRGSHVDIEFVADGATERLRAAYVIGCDIDFVGFTYPERFIKIATPFDFGTVNRNLAIRNFFADPDEWCNVFKVRGERPSGLWRVIAPIGPEESDEAALAPARIEERLQKFFPKAGRYPVEYVNVYGVSQRVAATFRRGRLLLAGDSAHVNNPIGGMGMNGGIHDAINLADKLTRVLHGEADGSLLDLYARQRRHAALEYVQAQTIANKKLMEERDPNARAANLDELRRVAENPETARRYMRRAALLDSLNSANAVR